VEAARRKQPKQEENGSHRRKVERPGPERDGPRSCKTTKSGMLATIVRSRLDYWVQTRRRFSQDPTGTNVRTRLREVMRRALCAHEPSRVRPRGLLLGAIFDVENPMEVGEDALRGSPCGSVTSVAVSLRGHRGPAPHDSCSGQTLRALASRRNRLRSAHPRGHDTGATTAALKRRRSVARLRPPP
jgi:hypothetical protein